MDIDRIFKIQTATAFESIALDTFRYQYYNNKVYQEFCDHLGKKPANVDAIRAIPFLPIKFFKSKKVISSDKKHTIVFTSSGTTGVKTSRHYVHDVQLYRKSFRAAFRYFYGAISEYCILALLPSYLERQGSSLIYMMDDLIKQSGHLESDFYLHDIDGLLKALIALDNSGKKVLLMGVSFALLDIVEKNRLLLKNTIVMETGGMKGKRKEMIRTELHGLLKKGFGVKKIHSEYGMTELLSQAYSQGDGIFRTPPWMKVFVRDTEDPLTLRTNEKTGGLNIIDLANINSCAFIATQDLGRLNKDGSFEVLGRFDHSDIRGCNLMVI